jgi:hypothetical protein
MQLTLEQANQLYPYKSDKIWFLMHALDEERCIERCLNSVKRIAHKMVIGIDDRTTDKTEEIAKSLGAITYRFKWIHSFSYAKNLCIKEAMKHGMQFGDWILVMGADFELNRLDTEFVKDHCNFFGEFEVPEHHKEGTQFVSRKRKLLWRHHPYIYWEKLVHEEAIYSAYRLTGQGIVFGTAHWKALPVVGEMTHYGFVEDGGEHGEIFWKKKGYYKVLMQIQKIMSKCNFPDTEDGILDALKIIYNNDEVYQMGIDKCITQLHERYMAGDMPLGLSPFADVVEVGAEHD